MKKGILMAVYFSLVIIADAWSQDYIWIPNYDIHGNSRIMERIFPARDNTPFLQNPALMPSQNHVIIDYDFYAQDMDFVPDMMIDPSAGPDQQATQRIFLETLQRLISTELTDKQRQALIAVRVQGMPLEEVARRMGTNRNALYKLLHDARQRLKRKMEAEGLSPEEVLSAFGTSR